MGLTLNEGFVLRGTKRLHLGLLGALHISYWFVYAYLIGLAGGHRSWASHGWIIGTIFRIIYFNIPLIVILILFYNFAMVNWGWFFRVPSDIIWSLKIHIWGGPYILSQFLSWLKSDGIHLILDLEWAKWRLYEPVTHNKDSEY